MSTQTRNETQLEATILDVTKSLRISGNPLKDEEACAQLHGHGVGGTVYEYMLLRGISAVAGLKMPLLLSTTAMDHTKAVIQCMECRDPFEAMIVTQALWTHARLAHLNLLACQQQHVDHLKVINDACDKASNTYRRQMLGLAEYRRASRSSKANDLIVQITTGNIENATNEQGIGSGQGDITSQPAEVLSPLPRGLGEFAGINRFGEAMASEHRSED
jgi:hypothetical protein